MCDMHGGVHGGRFRSIPPMHAHVSCRVYRRLANEKFYMPVVHGTGRVGPPLDLRSQLTTTCKRQRRHHLISPALSLSIEWASSELRISYSKKAGNNASSQSDNWILYFGSFSKVLRLRSKRRLFWVTLSLCLKKEREREKEKKRFPCDKVSVNSVAPEEEETLPGFCFYAYRVRTFKYDIQSHFVLFFFPLSLDFSIFHCAIGGTFCTAIISFFFSLSALLFVSFFLATSLSISHCWSVQTRFVAYFSFFTFFSFD
jgi:hypothetical protein